jgi:hypothetical protein
MEDVEDEDNDEDEDERTRHPSIRGLARAAVVP